MKTTQGFNIHLTEAVGKYDSYTITLLMNTAKEKCKYGLGTSGKGSKQNRLVQFY